MNGVEWRDVPGWEREYQASSDGRVRRHPLWNPPRGAHLNPGDELAQVKLRRGYLGVKFVRGGLCYRQQVHRLVAAAFFGAPEEGITVNHKNFDRQDNCVENLEYMTMAENREHAKLHKRHVRGEAQNLAKLTADKVRTIRLLATEHSFSELARRYGVTQPTIEAAVKRHTWAHVE
jgi:hypothetical protein